MIHEKNYTGKMVSKNNFFLAYILKTRQFLRRILFMKFEIFK